MSTPQQQQQQQQQQQKYDVTLAAVWLVNASAYRPLSAFRA